MLTPEQRARYERQMLFRSIGEEGQERLRQGTALIAGMGAIGCIAAEILARAGIGRLALVDHDTVELSNLQRQFLYDEPDTQSGRPKAEIAAAKLRAINSEVEVTTHVERFTDENGARLLQGVDLIVDAVDNFRTKFALNTAALRADIPMIYGAVAGSFGVTMPIIPGRTGCLCCLYCEEPDVASSETAGTAGVVASIVLTIASFQAAQALKWLVGAHDEVVTDVFQIDVWDGEVALLPAPRRAGCAACGEGNT